MSLRTALKNCMDFLNPLKHGHPIGRDRRIRPVGAAFSRARRFRQRKRQQAFVKQTQALLKQQITALGIPELP